MTSCLGRRIAELADGRLSGAERESALAHVAVCASCRGALDTQRAMRSRLSGASLPGPSSDFLARLSRVPDTTTAVPIVDRSAVRKRRQRLGLAGASAAVLTVAIAGGMGSLSQVATTAPVVVPNLVSFAAEHQSSAQRMPLGGPALSADGARARSVRLEAGLDPNGPTSNGQTQQSTLSSSAP